MTVQLLFTEVEVVSSIFVDRYISIIEKNGYMKVVFCIYYTYITLM